MKKNEQWYFLEEVKKTVARAQDWMSNHIAMLDMLIRNNPNDVDLGKALREYWEGNNPKS